MVIRPGPFPKNNLKRLQRQASPDTATVTSSRALEPTSHRMNLSESHSLQYILETVKGLSATEFVESVLLSNTWFDVYACYRDGYGWYVKIGENDDGLLVLSHHEPEFEPVVTVSGLRVHGKEPQEAD